MDIKKLKKFVPLIGIVLLCLAAYGIYNQTKDITWQEMLEAFHNTGFARIALATCIALLDYCVISLNDCIGMKVVGKKLSFGKTLFSSFISNSISFNAGMFLLTGAGSRFRMYSSFGVTPMQILGVQTYCSLAIVLSTLTSLTLAYSLLPVYVWEKFPWLWIWGRAPALLTGLGLVVIFTLSFLKARVKVKKVEVQFPSYKYLIAQMCFSLTDLLLQASIIYILLPGLEMSIFIFVGCYVIALILGNLSQVPGGVGVIDGIILVCLKGMLPTAQIVSALLIYRIVYYLLPLILSTFMLAFYELRQKRLKSTAPDS